MFLFGLIVGIVVGSIGLYFGLLLLAHKMTGMSSEELNACGNLMIAAGHNRESTIMAYDEDGELGRVILEET